MEHQKAYFGVNEGVHLGGANFKGAKDLGIF